MNAPLTREQRKTLRRQEADRNRARMLDRCRALMAAGCFRPTATEICGRGGEHHVTNHFGGLPRLYEEALDDATVRAMGRCVLQHTSPGTLGDLHRLARAIVFGRLST